KRPDDMSAFPSEERGLNQGFFDVLVATVAKLTFGLLEPLNILMWNSPVLTGAAFLILAAFLWKRVSSWCAVLFLVMITAYPGPLTQVSSLGNGDHHSFEIFLAVLLVLSLAAALRPQSPVGYILMPALILNVF